MDDDKVRLDLVYGMAVHQPLTHVELTIARPRNWLEACWWWVRGFVYDVVIPAFLFALAFTAFKYAILA